MLPSTPVTDSKAIIMIYLAISFPKLLICLNSAHSKKKLDKRINNSFIKYFYGKENGLTDFIYLATGDIGRLMMLSRHVGDKI